MLKRIVLFLHETLDIPNAVAASIVVTLFTFSFGYLITWSVSAFSRRRKRYIYKKSLKLIIINFLSSCKLQHQELLKFDEQKGFLNGDNYTVIIKSNYAHNYLSKIDLKEFIENFSTIRVKRAQEISDFFEIVETVRIVNELFKDQYKMFYSSYEKNLEIYNLNLDSLRKIQDDLILEMSAPTIINPQVIKYIPTVLSVFENWAKNGASIIINATNDQIVGPLHQGAISNPPNNISKKILDHCMQCKMAVANIENIEKLMKEEILHLRSTFKHAYERGSELIIGW